MANNLNTPLTLKTPIAENATPDNIMEIPDIYDPDTDYGVGGQDIGFPTECRLPIKNNDGTPGLGRAPKMQIFNRLFNIATSHNYFMQNGGMYTFNQEVSDKIGGYPKGAVLAYYDAERGLRFVRSLIGNNTYNFNLNPAYIDGQKWEDVIATMGDVQFLFETIYPIGSIYLTVNPTCPLAAIFGTWQLVDSGKALWTGNGTNGGQSIAPGLPQHTHSGTTGNMSANSTGGVRNLATAQGGYDQGGAIPIGYGNMTASKTSSTYNKEDGNHYSHGNGDIAINVQHVHDFTTGNASNSVYGNSDTVQPPAYIINAFQRIA